MRPGLGAGSLGCDASRVRTKLVKPLLQILSKIDVQRKRHDLLHTAYDPAPPNLNQGTRHKTNTRPRLVSSMMFQKYVGSLAIRILAVEQMSSDYTRDFPDYFTQNK